MVTTAPISPENFIFPPLYEGLSLTEAVKKAESKFTASALISFSQDKGVTYVSVCKIIQIIIRVNQKKISLLHYGTLSNDKN